MTEYHVEPLLPSHCEQLALVMRRADVDEVWAAGHVTPLAALRRSLAASRDAGAGFIDGQIACAFGVAPATVLGASGCPWMLGSDLIEQHAVGFLRRSAVVVARWKQDYDRLANFVDARNTRAIEWLRWLGFTIHPAAEYGEERLPFHLFDWTRQ